jgi:hypothetical protein
MSRKREVVSMQRPTTYFEQIPVEIVKRKIVEVSARKNELMADVKKPAGKTIPMLRRRGS